MLQLHFLTLLLWEGMNTTHLLLKLLYDELINGYRIVNRLAKELDLIDQILPYQITAYLSTIINMLGIFASLALGSVYMLIAVVVVVVGYYFFQWYYRVTYIEIQRLESLSRAPIFSQVGETLRGAPTIRAYKMQQVFKNVNSYSIDTNSAHRYAQKFVLA